MESDVGDPCVHIMASKMNGTRYTGVTSNLALRVFQHRSGSSPGFTKRYGCKILVWYERFPTMAEAIAREKQIEGGSRQKKCGLIADMNPTWTDLYDGLAG